MEPRIQYARTSDGVNIAYWALGEGPALVHLNFNFSHVQLEWEIPQLRDWYQRLASNRTLVRFDQRGMGLSDGTFDTRPPDYIEGELEAVTSRLGLERFALLGLTHSALLAIAYAVAHPERVSHLLLWHGFASAEEWLLSPQIQALRAMTGLDWETLTEAIAHTLYGWSEGDAARHFATLIRESVTRDAYPELVQAINQWDVSGLLQQVRVPTLVMQRRESPLPVLSVARGLAARIPDARFLLLEGSLPAPYLGDAGAVFDAIEEFLGGTKTEARDAPSTPFRTVLFTDLVGHTEMMSRLGDERGRAVLREHERITREVLKDHGGREIKTDGDSFMVSFASVSAAVECAVTLQRAFAEYSVRAEEPIVVRMGLNAGEPIEEEGPDGRSDLFGATVILASRIAARAEGGEILVADTVRGLCSGKGFLFSDRGEFVAKGFEEPVRVYEVRWRE